MTDNPERPSAERNPGGEADGTVRVQYEWASTTPSMAVIEAIAVALDREATAFGTLYESVDPDALDALLRSNGSSATPDDLSVTFTVADRQVTVHGSGEVVVRADSPGR